MNSHLRRRSLKHLGTLHGHGHLLVGNGEQSLGTVSYEIDGYFDQVMRSDNGRIEGGQGILSKAFDAGAACIALADGQVVDIVLADPEGSATAEVTVKGRFPQFDHAV